MAVLVIGCGLMGKGIAFVAAATAKLDVVIVDSSSEALDGAIKYINRIAQREQLNSAEILARIQTCTSIEQAFTSNSHIYFALEAVPEKIDLKTKIFAQLVQFSGSQTILATNTSSLPITTIAESVPAEHQWRVIGMHFFNPVPRVRGLEVIPTKYTSPSVIDKTVSLARQLGKTVAICRLDIAGFLVNRILNASSLEALRLLEQKAGTPQDIDRIMQNAAGNPMGPFRMTDMVGLDTALAVSRIIYEQSGRDLKYKPSQLLEKMVSEGKLGMKTGEGFYKYNKL